MAAGTLPKPGSNYGPCWDAVLGDVCRHPDCAETRVMAAQVCRLCKERIGYERRYYVDPDSEGKSVQERELVHAACLEDYYAAKQD